MIAEAFVFQGSDGKNQWSTLIESRGMNTVTAVTFTWACLSDFYRDVQLVCPFCGSLAYQKNADLRSLLHL